MSKSKKRPSVTDKYQSKSSKGGGTKWGVLIVLGIAIAAFIINSIPKSTEPVGPRFTKEGELTISRDGNTLAELDIEFADTPEDIQQGLMYRRSMEQ